MNEGEFQPIFGSVTYAISNPIHFLNPVRKRKSQLMRTRLVYWSVLFYVLGFSAPAFSLSCVGIPEMPVRADTLDKETGLVQLSTGGIFKWNPDTQTGKEILTPFLQISPALLLADLKQRYDSSAIVFVGTIDSVFEIIPVKNDNGILIIYGYNLDSVGIQVSQVLKGNIGIGRQWFIDSMWEWDVSFSTLKGGKALWFLNRMQLVRNASSYRPRDPCGKESHGNPMDSSDVISEFGYYSDYKVGVPLSTFVASLANTNIQLRKIDGKAGSAGRIWRDMHRGYRLFKSPRSESLLGADGREYLR